MITYIIQMQSPEGLLKFGRTKNPVRANRATLENAKAAIDAQLSKLVRAA